MDIENPPWEFGLPGRAGDGCLSGHSPNTVNRDGPQVKHALRPYQLDVVKRLNASIAAGHKRPLLTMATGAGKTVVAAHIAAEAVQRGARVLILAHRQELITQMSAKLLAAGVGDHGIIKAGFPLHLDRRVQVASVQTLHARAFRTKKIELAEFDLVIIDEAHHSRAMTYQEVIDACPNAVIIGLTATPCRGDGLGLGNIFDDLIEGPSVEDLIRQGYLVGTKVFAPMRLARSRSSATAWC